MSSNLIFPTVSKEYEKDVRVGPPEKLKQPRLEVFYFTPHISVLLNGGSLREYANGERADLKFAVG